MKDFALDAVLTLLYFLALARLTRLIVADGATDWLREWSYNRDRRLNGGQDSKLTYFLECPWCVSLWLGLGSAWYLLLLTGWSWWWYPAVAFAASYVTGVFAANLEGSGDDIEVVDVPE